MKQNCMIKQERRIEGEQEEMRENRKEERKMKHVGKNKLAKRKKELGKGR